MHIYATYCACFSIWWSRGPHGLLASWLCSSHFYRHRLCTSVLGVGGDTCSISVSCSVNAVAVVVGATGIQGIPLIRTSLQLLWHFHSGSSLGGLFIKEKKKSLYTVMHYSQHRCQSDPWRHRLTRWRQAPPQNQRPLTAVHWHVAEVAVQTDAWGLWAFS